MTKKELEQKDLAALATENKDRELALTKLEAEVIALRAALAMSDQPCVYCSLPANEMNKCELGFPGCGRADDALGCPHLGSSLRVQFLEKALGQTCLEYTVGGIQVRNSLTGCLEPTTIFINDCPELAQYLKERTEE